MNHPDLDRLTAFVHGFLEPGEAALVESHVSGCPECRATASQLRAEARILSEAISRPERLSALKAGLVQAAAGRRGVRALLWQVPLAAAVLFGLIGVLLSNGARHSLVEGRVALQDGREVAAPGELAGSRAWELRALGKVRVRLSDQSTVNLEPGTELTLAPGGLRGVEAGLGSGTAEFTVAPDSRRLKVASPAGSVAAADGKFSLKIVFQEEGGNPVKKTLAGAIVTVFAGSMSLSSAGGSVEAQTGQSAVLAPAQTPLLLLASQDKQEDLLRRLEQLAARVAKLEEDVVALELKNKQLKLQLTANPANGAWGGLAPGQSVGGSVRVLNAGGVSGAGGPGSPVIIELKEESEKKPERAPQDSKQK
ncbi:MAG TPA: FecR domain-containing protein [Planctomycetota bacterium]|nr:FecR domain-containing protein [Planctomycetota bacterium]